MSYSKLKSPNNKCELYSRILSVLIALHIIISLTVIGLNHFNNKAQEKQHQVTQNGTHK